MKHSLLLAFLLMAGIYCRANAIDAIQTKKDLIKFMRSNHVKKYPSHLDVLDGDTLHQAYVDTNYGFYKMDVDGNKKTDIIISGGSVVVMDMDTGYVAYIIDAIVILYAVPYSFENAIQLPDRSMGLVYSHRRDQWRRMTPVRDTLIFKFNTFIEYQSPHKRPGVKAIAFGDSSHGGTGYYGTYMEINNSGDALYKYSYGDYGNNNNDSVGFFMGSIDKGKLKELWDLLTYLNFTTIDSSYYIYVTHIRSGTLHVYFEDGSIKKVYDYGFTGTLGLRAIYNKLFQLQESKDWVKR